MTNISGLVGSLKANNKSDVAIVQTCLKLIKTSAGSPFLSGSIDGSFGKNTKAAIVAFQDKYTGDANVGAGIMGAGGATIKKMASLLPIGKKDLRALPGQSRVYIAGSPNALAQSKLKISTTALTPSFKLSINAVIQSMYDKHKVVLGLAVKGGRRTFAQQAALSSAVTKAGPGESNHQWGNGADLGFVGLQWFKGNGALVTDDTWLENLRKTQYSHYIKFWDVRDAVATKPPNNLFTIRTLELIHLQAYSNSNYSASRSLAAHLTNVGDWTWSAIPGGPNRYACNLGGANNVVVDCGSAKKIFQGNASITAKEIETAGWIRPTSLASAAAELLDDIDVKPSPIGMFGAAAPTPPPASASLPITAADIAAVKLALQANFTEAEARWKEWKPVK